MLLTKGEASNAGIHDKEFSEERPEFQSSMPETKGGPSAAGIDDKEFSEV